VLHSYAWAESHRVYSSRVTVTRGDDLATQRFTEFSRAQWAALRANTPLPLSEAQLRGLAGVNEPMSVDEVVAIYLPLARLLNLSIEASRALRQATATFLGTAPTRVPFIIGLAGSVAVGKSTTARVLQALLAWWPSHPKVDLVTTDGFLLPLHALEARGLAARKGFPESYDLKRLVQFLADVKAGLPEVQAPVYSHLRYDIVPGQHQTVRRPDIVLVEGLNVLHVGAARGERPRSPFVSDFFDFAIYIDASEADIEQWYVDRFLTLRDTVFTDPTSYFHRYASLSTDDAEVTARGIWRTVNAVNLRENVLPSRPRAHVILEKGRDHAVRRVKLRTR
jgi:type I pantothenate kinase